MPVSPQRRVGGQPLDPSVRPRAKPALGDGPDGTMGTGGKCACHKPRGML